MIRVALILVVAVAAGLPRATCAADAAPAARGGRVGWARLITPDSGWGIHNDQDPKLASFIRTQTTLNIDPVWYSVDPENLEKLCAYPFVYAKNLLPVSDRSELKNIQEYLRRGGFLCIDPCTANFSVADRENFMRRHAEWFARMIPGSFLRELPDSHPIFRCYFSVGVEDLFTPDMIRLGAVRPASIGMQGVFLGDRLIAVISTSGLECGWPQTAQRVPGCMKMIVNAYVYAMTRSAAPPPRSP